MGWPGLLIDLYHNLSTNSSFLSFLISPSVGHQMKSWYIFLYVRISQQGQGGMCSLVSLQVIQGGSKDENYRNGVPWYETRKTIGKEGTQKENVEKYVYVYALSES